MYLERLLEFDKDAFLALNGSSSIYFDGFMWIYTSTVIWLPLALYMLYVIFKNKKWKEVCCIIFFIALVVTLCDQIASGFFKPFFKRLRPGHDPEIMYLVDTVNGYRGGRYGFISSHAANSFGLFTFTALLFRNKTYTGIMFVWALLTGFTRIYLGVHYVGDVICGSLVGVIIGGVLYYLYRLLISRSQFSGKGMIGYYSGNKYTSTGYYVADIKAIITVFFALLLLKMLLGMLFYDFFLL